MGCARRVLSLRENAYSTCFHRCTIPSCDAHIGTPPRSKTGRPLEPRSTFLDLAMIVQSMQGIERQSGLEDEEGGHESLIYMIPALELDSEHE